MIDAAEDIRGSQLYGTNNEKLGEIDDVIFDHSTGLIRYIVVNTGGWLTTKEFIVPADSLRPSAKAGDGFETRLSKQQIETFPPYQESDLDSTPDGRATSNDTARSGKVVRSCIA